MTTIIQPSARNGRPNHARSARAAFRVPPYQCEDRGDALDVVVYLPGVEASRVTVESRGPDLLVTACRPRVVRVNWRSLHLEPSQRDYRLRLRLGRGFAYEAMRAEMHEGVLTVTLPKRGAPALRQVA